MISIFLFFVLSGCSEDSLWDRMGGQETIQPMCNEIYDMHSTDPLTAEWFGLHPWTIKTAAEVKECVFTFFSAGIGGPHEYKCRSMEEAHEDMRAQFPLSEVSFHSLCYHVVSLMQKFEAGGAAEREAVLGILYSLKDSVMGDERRKFVATDSRPLWERMGGDKAMKEVVDEIYELHVSDPLTSGWFGIAPRQSVREPAQVKKDMFTFISSSTGGSKEFSGRTYADAFTAYKKVEPFTDVAFHAFANHFVRTMASWKAGGVREREEMLALLYSLRPQIEAGQASCKA